MPAQIELTDFASNVRSFLEDLSRNNERDWFRMQKSRYDAEVKRPAERLLESLVPKLEAQTGQTVRTKLFRPHRDVRFSEDKTPYHVHLHAVWSVPDGRGWYFGLAPDYATLGGGIMSFDDEQLENWREAVEGPAGDELLGLLTEMSARVDPPELKRVPAPHGRDHPHEDLLRRTGLVAWIDGIFDDLVPDPEAGLASTLDRLGPLQDWFDRHL